MEDKRSKNDKMSRGIWEAVEIKVGKVRIAEAKGRRSQRGGRKETREKGRKTEKEARKNNRYEESSGEVRNLV